LPGVDGEQVIAIVAKHSSRSGARPPTRIRKRAEGAHARIGRDPHDRKVAKEARGLAGADASLHGNAGAA
jgi:hypothetical protein